jgi:Flp pilus assembly protein TadG
MRQSDDSERGQAVVEFAVIGLILLALTVGLVDAGRAFYQYNEIQAAAEYAARWAAVQGGTCADNSTLYESTADWCNGLTTSGTKFWAIAGNYPAQTPQTGSCPTGYDSAGTSSYALSNATYSASTTIVGTIKRRLDTSSSKNTLNVGNWLTGLDQNNVRVCIQLSTDAYQSSRSPAWEPEQGDWVTVFVYYHFAALSGLFGQGLTINMSASSQYMME